jgi:hypothetical protein
MSPPAGDVAQTPEPKTSSGFASVFKNLTGGRSSKSPHAQSPPPSAQQHNATSAPLPSIYGGPPNFEQLYEQLKAGNSLADRTSAAQALRIAVQDYPITSVSIAIQAFYLKRLTNCLGYKSLQARKGPD